MADLADALTRSRKMIEEALAEARAELDALRSRERALEEEIAQAEATLSSGRSMSQDDVRMTLHEALAQILKESDNRWMTARELADSVNTRGLYRKRDGSTVEVNQIHARTNNYSSVFEKDGSKIRLREESPMLATTPQGFIVFRDDDEGFFEWLEANPDGFFINTTRNPTPAYLVLHRPECPHFKGDESLQWTKDYVKVCSPDRDALEQWANDTVGGEVTLCRSCFG